MPSQRRRSETGLDAFELFCVYHLGLLPTGEARILNIHHVAVHFSVSPEQVREALVAHRMTPELVTGCTFDAAGAQADIAVAPPGVDRHELAREAYLAFRKAQGSRRDWAAELAQAAAENAEDPLYRRKKDASRP